MKRDEIDLRVRTHLQQPRSSRLCGPYSLAMLAGVDVDTAIAASSVVTRRGMRHCDIIDAAKKLGLRPKSNLWTRVAAVVGVVAPVNAICKCQGARRRNWHWVAVVDGVIHDPAAARPEVLREPMISFMEFDRRNEA